MAGMAGAFFLYAASGLLAPWWVVGLLLVLWLVLFVIACSWFTPHPKRVVVVPVVAVVLWFGIVVAVAAVG
jgi:hypothetical protein